MQKLGDWDAKVGSQEITGVTGKFAIIVQNEAGQRVIKFCQENTLVIANTLFQQHKRRLCTWTSPEGQHQNQADYILCSRRQRTSTQSAKTRPGADCGSDHAWPLLSFPNLLAYRAQHFHSIIFQDSGPSYLEVRRMESFNRVEDLKTSSLPHCLI